MVSRGSIPESGCVQKVGLVNYPSELIEGTLQRRYKRFLADVQLPDGTLVVAHCPNSGAMTGCWEPGAPCRVTHRPDPKRKLKYTLEQVCMDGVWILVNTMLPNHVVAEGIQAGAIPELSGYELLLREKRYGQRNSRIDILLLNGGTLPPDAVSKVVKGVEQVPATEAAYVEVKNVTLMRDGAGWFPDAVTTRGTRHLMELMDVVKAGHRGVLVFHVGREDCAWAGPEERVDPVYARTLREAVQAGVEVLAYRCEVSASGAVLGQRLPVRLEEEGVLDSRCQGTE